MVSQLNDFEQDEWWNRENRFNSVCLFLRRAVELCFALINPSNVRTMIKELIFYLDKCDPDFKSYVASNILQACERWVIILQTAEGKINY